MAKVTSMAIPLEDQETKAVATWLRRKGYSWFHHSPNEARRTPRLGKKLKDMGMSPGFPDLMIFEVPEGASFYGVAIEMKRRNGGRITPEQAEWLAYLADFGWCTKVCRGAQEAMQYLTCLGY
jgi:hypothetical protein